MFRLITQVCSLWCLRKFSKMGNLNLDIHCHYYSSQHSRLCSVEYVLDNNCRVVFFLQRCWLFPGLFYYAGHGYDHAGRNYLIAVDAPQPYQPENCVCVQRILLSMQKKQTALSVILLDTCRKW